MVNFSEIVAAYERIKNQINHTPIMTSRTLNANMNAEIYFKCENFQRIGAFKFRGAFNALSQLTPAQRKKGVIAHSSGNHAQAVAFAAKLLGIKATIVMPDASALCKVNATRETYGATVVFCENSLEARQETTNALIEQYGYVLIHPYDNDQIIAGAGTVAYEFLQEHPELDIMMAPVGGGGLLSGTSLATKGLNPNILVYGCEPAAADDAYRSYYAGELQHNEGHPQTIADGLRTELSDRTFEIISQNVDAIYTVSEEAIIDALQFLWERMKLVIEPSSAVPLAVLMSQQIPVGGKRIGIILSGGNIDLSEFFSLLRAKIAN